MSSGQVEAVLATDELDRRPPRTPDFRGENEALRELMASYAERPEAVLNRLVELAMRRCNADGAGLSTIERKDDGEEFMRWLATSGAFESFQGKLAPRSVSPADIVIRERCSQLMVRPSRQFKVMDEPDLTVEEELLAPFMLDGEVVGTLWVATFDPNRHFDAEDRRLLESLALFASTAWQRHLTEESARKAIEKANEDLEVQVARRTEDLVAKNQELEGFTYSVSHDLRAPLRAMISNATLVLRDEGARVSVEGQERLNRLASNARHMALLLDDLLGYARLGTRELRIEPVDLSALARQVLQELDPEFADCAAAIEIEPGIVADCDPRLVGMALQNLFENACKYRRPEGPLRVRFGCRSNEDGTAYFVQDDGLGFEMAYVDKLFRPFERLHREQYVGTGIGLANVRRVIERHGGRVWAESDGPNRGSTFYFTLA